MHRLILICAALAASSATSCNAARNSYTAECIKKANDVYGSKNPDGKPALVWFVYKAFSEPTKGQVRSFFFKLLDSGQVGVIDTCRYGPGLDKKRVAALYDYNPPEVCANAPEFAVAQVSRRAETKLDYMRQVESLCRVEPPSPFLLQRVSPLIERPSPIPIFEIELPKAKDSGK